MNEFILITGATSDIGIAVASLLSKEHKLILHGRSIEKLDILKKKLYNSEDHLVWNYDFADISQLKNEFSAFLANSEVKVKAFVHVAGFVEITHLRLLSNEVLLNHFNVNLFSAVEIISTLLKKSNKHYFKNIIFISSTYANFGGKGQVAYSASKASIDGFIRGAAVELAPDIRVNSILPGGVKNGKSSHYEPQYLENLEVAHPLGFGEPIDVANMVEYLISEKARWVTGQSFVIDGGYSINSIKGE